LCNRMGAGTLINSKQVSKVKGNACPTDKTPWWL
jgi:hypothetical protein